MSVSRIPILLSINNVIDIEGELVRHLSPLTIKKILGCLPISQLVINFQNKYIQVSIELNIGIEKPKNIFKKGDIAFSPISNSICIFLNDYYHNNQLNHIGFVKNDDLEKLKKTKAGDILNIRRI
jgi:hypothetical protein